MEDVETAVGFDYAAHSNNQQPNYDMHVENNNDYWNSFVMPGTDFEEGNADEFSARENPGDLNMEAGFCSQMEFQADVRSVLNL